MVQGIDGISGANGALGSTASQYSQAMTDAMTAVAQQLGMSQTALQSALQSGQTLTQIASAKGISSSELTNTIQTSLKAGLPNASSNQIANLTQRVEGGHHHGGHASAAGASESGAGTGADALEQLEELLGNDNSSSTTGAGTTSIYA
jgi:nanoRNase/pAp phosphatase (c-di-AMP/oligoRNAs hydrolase)